MKMLSNKKCILAFLGLIAIFIRTYAISMVYSKIQDKKEYRDKYVIREGILANHKKTIEFVEKGQPKAEVELNEPIVVSQSDIPLGWGYYQFPSMYRLNDGNLLVSWQMKEDSYKAYGKKDAGNNKMISKDNGNTWIDYDSKYDNELYSYSLKDHNEYMSIYIPNPTNISKYEIFPTVVDEVDNYGIKYKFYHDSELPEEIKGVYVRKWKNIKVNEAQIKSFHAKFKDEGLCRYATDNQMSVLWGGKINKLKNGDIVGNTYRGFYCDDNGKILPSGISFYKWNEGDVAWDILGKIPYQPDLIADSKGNERKVWGFTEPTFIEIENGALLCVFRSTEENNLTPLYRAFSIDGGKTWSKPEAFTPNGVDPNLLRLGNGTLVLTSGRPGIQIRFCFDGKGIKWTEPIEMMKHPIVKGILVTHGGSCGYTDILAVDNNTFFIVYSLFSNDSTTGKYIKSIMFRKVSVRLS